MVPDLSEVTHWPEAESSLATQPHVPPAPLLRRGSGASWCQAGPEREEPRASPQRSEPPVRLWSLPPDQSELFKTTADEWVLLNLNVTGYFQVNYDENNWRKIQTQLQTNLSVGVCHPRPVPCCRPSPRTAASPRADPEATCSFAPSRSSLSSIGLRSSMMPLTWPGERHLPPQAAWLSRGRPDDFGK